MTQPDLEFDLDGDGVADIVVSDTNGHTVYANVDLMLRKALGS